MGQLTIGNIDHKLLVQLKRKAWQEGLPLETFVRRLLRSGVDADELEGASMPPRSVRFLIQTEPAERFRFHA